jgi:hypothetical protein
VDELQRDEVKVVKVAHDAIRRQTPGLLLIARFDECRLPESVSTKLGLVQSV